MKKPLCLIRAPIETRSGYGDAARDICRHIIEYDKYEVVIHSIPWGNTPMNALDEKNPVDKILLDRILKQNLTKKPELFISITIPGEFEKVGRYNIGITAGIESTLISPEWIHGCNKMDTVWLMSNFGKEVFENTAYLQKHKATNVESELKVTCPVDVLHNCVNTKIFKKIDSETELEKTVRKELDQIPEKFNFLFVGHWLRGDFGEDRKNVGMLIKIFLETFKQVSGDKPGLILKTSGANFSLLDQEQIVHKIETIKKSVKLESGQTLPNVYLLHGYLTDKEMNSLYNHPKVKSHVSFTKGEGFGRPLLEASLSGKPVIASGWSGHLDFLNLDEAVLVGGTLTNIHESSAWDKVLLKEAQWFSVDLNEGANGLFAVYSQYSKFKKKAAELAKKNRSKFNYDVIRQKTIELLSKYVPKGIPVQTELKLPTPKLDFALPELSKVQLDKIGTPNNEK